ncbi:YkvA family protein [Gracilinema caldarium]|uniref:DUF1232 domain-containing protein n=1 Tax=Gracilinema caldarium (strain ATCC 51460 / DSM 7334 / H1) TaxID=744872 RepID=F8F3B1_GRAC1|nr:YkvA family protein [Gracilinema caldarium]AEJ20948.1 protein of unknown function DUF1232 [Gracilinema caldarium DSM 7334]
MNIKHFFKSLASWAKQTIGTLYYVSKHPETPWLAKLLTGIALAYALSPIDLIPDFIPLLGYLDDFIILPLLVGLAIKLVPKELLSVCAAEAEAHPVSLKKQWGVALVILCIWLLVIWCLVRRFWL